MSGQLFAALLQTSGDSASSRLSLVIWALCALAAIIAVVTVVFWRLTRPERPAVRRRIVRDPEPPAH